jgi:hypothetical protein
VVHVIVADVAAIPLEVTALITGIVGRVRKVKFADVEGPPESPEITA